MLAGLSPPAAAAKLVTMSLDEDARWLEWVTKQFETIAGEDKEIDLEEFKTALKVKESFFAERFFALFDSDGSGSISLDELLKALDLLIHGNETDKLRFLFQVYDVDGQHSLMHQHLQHLQQELFSNVSVCSGSIDPDELKTVLKSCLRESAISLPEEKLDDLTLALFESADKDNSGSITFEELKAELETFPEVMENLTISAANWLKPPDLDQKKRQTPRYLTRAYWQNNSRKLLFLAVYSLLNLLLFIVAMLRHSYGGPWFMVAKGCGQCLNFNCTFVMVLMLRRCLTWLRATWVVRVFPLDQNILLHQIVGCAILGFTLVHTAAHAFNFGISTHPQSGEYSLWEYLLTTRPGIGWVKGTASLTGVVLQVLICLMVLCSSTFVRRSGHFEVFYWSHLSYVWVWILLIIHCANFWKWFVVPGLVFVLEKIVGIAVSHMGGLYIVEVNLLPSKVTHLVIKRPQFFQFKPGDYVFINIPVIAKYEWHPFTISSAPEQSDTLWLHIRSLGQWTTRLYEYFRELESEALGPNRLATSLRKRRQLPRAQVSAKLTENHRFCNIKCYVDGPYGTPTRQIFASEHAVLIGAGIGITPFASILQSIMYRMRKKVMFFTLQVDFIWINRDQKSFEWFVSLLTKLEMDQADEEPEGRFLEMHMYMTSALSKNDMKAIGLQMALDLLAKKEKRDSITGLRTRTQPGRPEWGKVRRCVSEENKGKVHVFYCGAPALAKVIKAQCEDFGFNFYKENF
uniref:NADPH oxidase 5 n=1 Tax=Pundamilia nyererei TaxID=303518 RepID=A0A3B4EXR4_9CICH